MTAIQRPVYNFPLYDKIMEIIAQSPHETVNVNEVSDAASALRTKLDETTSRNHQIIIVLLIEHFDRLHNPHNFQCPPFGGLESGGDTIFHAPLVKTRIARIILEYLKLIQP